MPAVGAVEEELLAGLGWKMGRQVIKLETYRVKVGTQLIMLQQDRAQHQLLTEFAAIVGPGLSATNVLHVLGRMWQLPWENKDRAVLWRLVLNGLPTAERRHDPTGECGCGQVTGAGRMHAYFACPVAQKVVAEVAAELHGEWGLLGWNLTPPKSG